MDAFDISGAIKIIKFYLLLTLKTEKTKNEEKEIGNGPF